MAGNTRVITALITANPDEAIAAFRDVGAAADETAESTGAANEESMGGFAKFGAVAAAVGVAVAVVAVKLAMAYQATTAQVANAAGISMAAATKIGNAFLHTAGTTIFTGEQIQTAYASVAGELGTVQGHALNASQAMEVMRAAMNLAEGSGTDLGTATASLGTIMQAFGVKVAGAAYVSDVLFNTSRLTGTAIAGVTTTLVRLHTQLGVTTPPLAQLGGMLVDLAEHGEAGRGAVSALSSGLLFMLKPLEAVQAATSDQKIAFDALTPSLKALATQYENGTITGTAYQAAVLALPASQATLLSAFTSATSAITTNQQKLKSLGITVDGSDGKFVGLASVIGQLHQKTLGMTQAQALATDAQTLGTTAAAKMFTVIEAGPAAFAKATAAVAKAGSAAAAAALQSKTLHDQWETLKAGAIDLLTELGLKLLPVIEVLGRYLLRNKDIVFGLAAAFGVIIVAAIGAFAAAVIGTAVSVVASMATIVVALGSAAIAWGTVFAIQAAGFISTAALATAAFVAENLATLGIAAGIALLIAVVVYLALHWRQTWGTIKAEALAVWHFLDNDIFHPIVDFFSGPFHTQLAAAELDWHDIWQGISAVALAVWHIIDGDVVQPLMAVFSGPFHDAIAGAEATWTAGWDGIRTAALAVWRFVYGDVLRPIVSFLGSQWHDEIKGAEIIWDTVWSGIKSAVSEAWSDLQPIFNFILRAVHDVTSGISAVTGLVGGISHIGGGIAGWVKHHTALGGLVHGPTILEAGETGDELILNPMQTRAVLTGGSVSAAHLSVGGAGGGGGGVTNYYVTISNPDPQAVVNLLKLYVQRNGALPF
jgi:TP901 family phage tail tape measure protein